MPRFFLAFILTFCLGSVVAAEVPRLPLWTTQRIRELPRDQARAGQSVRLLAVVTYVFVEEGISAVIVSDGAGALFAQRKEPLYCHPGDVVEIEGITQAGSFAPSILITKFLPSPALVEAKPAVEGRIGAMKNGSLDCQSVWLRGVVQSVAAGSGSNDHSYQLVIRTPEGNIPANLTFLTQENESARQLLFGLVDCEVMVQGVCCTIFNPRGEWRGSAVHLNSLSQIQTLKQSNPDPFVVPDADITTLRTYSIDGPILHRRRITGVVSVVQNDRVFYLQQKGRGVRITLSESYLPLDPGGTYQSSTEVATSYTRPRVGQTVEVTGFITQGDAFAGFEDAQVRPLTDLLADLHPLRITRQTILDTPGDKIFSDFHGRLVTIRGLYRGSVQQGDQSFFYLECDGYITRVHSQNHPKLLDNLPQETVLDVTGVVVIKDPEERGTLIDFPWAEGFSLILRSPEDVVIVSRAPWWTIRRLSTLLVVALLVVVGILGWNRSLRRRVEHRTQELVAVREAQIADQLRLEERSRIAAELHDTIAQSLTGIALQLQTARAVLPKLPEKGLACIQAAVSVISLARHDLRHAVWNLRSGALADGDLLGAVREMIDQLALGDAVKFKVNLRHFPRALSRVEIVQIFSVLREAVTNAVRHGHATEIAINAVDCEDVYRVIVEDNGTGFDLSQRENVGNGHFGLASMTERMRRLGAEVLVESKIGEGVRITVFRRKG